MARRGGFGGLVKGWSWEVVERVWGQGKDQKQAGGARARSRSQSWRKDGVAWERLGVAVIDEDAVGREEAGEADGRGRAALATGTGGERDEELDGGGQRGREEAKGE